MVVDQSGLGKSTFINTLFQTEVYGQDVPSPGFGDSVDNSKCLQSFDIEFMKRFDDRVNIISVNAKADTLTSDELHKVPFTVVGSNFVLERETKRSRVRQYAWGTVNVEDEVHSDFIALRSMIIRTNLNDLRDSLTPPKNYTWPQDSKNLCFAGQFDLVLNVDYTKANGAKASAKIPLNNNTYESYRVSCSVPTNVHELTISMLNSFTEILLSFSVDAKNMTSLKKIYGYITFNDKQTYITEYAPSLEGVHHFSSNVSLFEADRGNSYRCDTKTTVTGFNTTNNVTVTSIELENLRVQAFADDSKEFSDYGVEKVCSADADKNSNLIPIIVGACLAVLVVVVLVAYLIGRRRNRNGYQSV
ncbi:hypothetical protein I4U23_009643 [Adineta vaga]|nr:hypothetical protein I4U23_009643 [Adineta vaga]